VKAKFTYLQFVIWQAITYKPFISGFEYTFGGTNCQTWTRYALVKAKFFEKLPIYP